MPQYDLYLIRNDHPTGVEFTEVKLAKPPGSAYFLTQNPSTGACSWAKAAWSDIEGKPGTFTPESHNHTTAQVTGLDTALAARILSSEKGAANGVATLDSGGKVPANQLPSYVDDVLEYANQAAFPATGETGKIYTSIDTNKIYRWSGTAYIEISPTAGNADTATKLATPRTIAASGDASWSVNFDGSANVSAALTLSASGATAGTYSKVTVDAKGRVTAGASLAATDIPNLDAAKITSGTFSTGLIPNLDAAKINSGTFADARIPNLDASKINAGTLADARIPTLAISKISGLQTALDGKLSWVAFPTTVTSSGSAGNIAYSTNYIYVCIATNTWRRIPISAWSGSTE